MLLAQNSITDVDNPATNFDISSSSSLTITSFLTGGAGNFNLVNLAFFLVGLIFFANLVIAAVTYITSEGSPDSISKANSRFTTGIIGLVIVFASFVIVKLVATIFGFGDFVPVIDQL